MDTFAFFVMFDFLHYYKNLIEIKLENYILLKVVSAMHLMTVKVKSLGNHEYS